MSWVRRDVSGGWLVDTKWQISGKYLSIEMDLATEEVESLLVPKWHGASESSRTSSSRC